MGHKKTKRPGYKTLTTTQSNEATHTQCARMKHFVGEKTWSFWKGRGLMVEKKGKKKERRIGMGMRMEERCTVAGDKRDTKPNNTPGPPERDTKEGRKTGSLC